jgi:monoamine oxidase
MARSALFDQLTRIVRLGAYADRRGLATEEAVSEAVSLERRRFLGAAGAAAGIFASGCAEDVGTAVGHARVRPTRDVAVVGAGIAGIACATELQRQGIDATLYEAGDRVGGRMFSAGGAFPATGDFAGQIIERGGELIDTTHTTIKGYARSLGLTLEDISRDPGEVFYAFNGVRYAESAVVDEYRAFVDAMRDDLRLVAEPTADRFTPDEARLDRMSLAEYLDARRPGALIRKVLETAYTIEYGVEPGAQSALAFLQFIHADRRSRFKPFGIFSDERFHVVEGNQSIPVRLAAQLNRAPSLGHRLVRVRRLASGRVELTLQAGSRTVTTSHEAVVIALPAPVLRGVALDASLALPAWKLRAINELRYGANTKMMLSFQGRPWADLGSNGSSYSDRPNLQATWETAPGSATASRAVLTNYSGGDLAARIDPRRATAEVGAFLTDLDAVFPGASARVRRDGRGAPIAHIESWLRNPLALGGYTANHPGYFTTIAGLEGRPVNNLFFAGEHTDSFYDWQGFMEGGANSGIRAAGEVVSYLR